MMGMVLGETRCRSGQEGSVEGVDWGVGLGGDAWCGML